MHSRAKKLFLCKRPFFWDLFGRVRILNYKFAYILFHMDNQLAKFTLCSILILRNLILCSIRSLCDAKDVACFGYFIRKNMLEELFSVCFSNIILLLLKVTLLFHLLLHIQTKPKQFFSLALSFCPISLAYLTFCPSLNTQNSVFAKVHRIL